MSDSDNNTCHLAILSNRYGFSKMYLMGLSFATSQVLWYNIYYLSLSVVQVNAQHIFSNEKYLAL